MRLKFNSLSLILRVFCVNVPRNCKCIICYSENKVQNRKNEGLYFEFDVCIIIKSPQCVIVKLKVLQLQWKM